MDSRKTFDEIDAAIARVEAESDHHSTRMKKILEGIAQVRKSDERLDKAISFFENFSREESTSIFYFGGFLRDAYLGFQPRDIDLVVTSNWELFQKSTEKFTLRKNRFGGLKMNVHKAAVDAWELGSTDAFQRGVIAPFSPNMLPYTTVFNAESIALEIYAPEEMYWGWEAGFFDACETKTLEIQNYHNSDFMETSAPLQLARTYHLQKKLGWKLGPGLRNYVQRHIKKVDPTAIKKIYESHYDESCNAAKLISQLERISS